MKEDAAPGTNGVTITMVQGIKAYPQVLAKVFNLVIVPIYPWQS
jgi:hypothetical protein